MHPIRAAASVMIGLMLCSCGGGGASSPAGLSQTPAGPTTQSIATESYPLSGSALNLTLPSVSTFAGQMQLPALGAVPAGTVLTVTTSLAAPAQAPTLASSARRPLSSGSLNILVYVTFSVSHTVTLPSLPSFAVRVAASVSTAAPEQFFYAISDPTVTNVVSHYRTEGPAIVSGQTLNFAASPDSLTLAANTAYVFAFYRTAPATVSGPHLYVSSTEKLVIYSLFDLTAPPQIVNAKVGEGYDATMAFDAAGRLYSLDDFTQTVHIFDTVHNVQLPPIANPQTFAGGGVAVDANGKLYVSNFRYGNVEKISVFDTTHADAALPPITLPITDQADPEGMVISPSGKLYVTTINSLNPRLNALVFDTLHGNALLPPIVGNVGPNTIAAALDPSGKLYIALFPSADGSNKVAVFDTANDNVQLPSITVRAPAAGSGGITSLAVDGDGRLFVAVNTELRVFDTKHGNTELPPLTAGLTGAFGLAIR